MKCTAPRRDSHRSRIIACSRGGWSSAAYASFSSAHRNWDMHGTNYNEDVINKAPLVAGETDRASAALIKDLKQRGLLDSTLMIWAGEFGRTPMRQARVPSWPRPSPEGIHDVDGGRRSQARHELR